MGGGGAIFKFCLTLIKLKLKFNQYFFAQLSDFYAFSFATRKNIISEMNKKQPGKRIAGLHESILSFNLGRK